MSSAMPRTFEEPSCLVALIAAPGAADQGLNAAADADPRVADGLSGRCGMSGGRQTRTQSQLQETPR